MNAVEISDAARDACFAKSDRLARLQCYDRLFNRPEEAPVTVAPAPVAAQGHDIKTTETARLLALSGANRNAAARMIVSSSDTLEPARNQDYDALKQGAPESFDNFRREFDVWVAVETLPDVGEKAVMLFGCDQNITTLRFAPDAPVSATRVPVQLYWNTQIEDAASHNTVMRVVDQGAAIEAPRGLESIRLLNHFASGSPVLQLSYTDENSIHSAFFPTTGLRGALGDIALHCEWK